MTVSARYALQLIDTVLIGSDKATCLTSGLKSIKDTMFFLNQDEGEGQSSKAPAKKPPTAKVGANGNASPSKNKMAGGKVLRNKTRSAAQEELVQSMAAKIADHQRELHQRLHQEGLARFSEGGGGTGGKEGKGWKRFQSYKGEAALPREVESLRVRPPHPTLLDIRADGQISDLCRQEVTDSCATHSWLRGSLPHQYHQERQQKRGS